MTIALIGVTNKDEVVVAIDGRDCAAIVNAMRARAERLRNTVRGKQPSVVAIQTAEASRLDTLAEQLSWARDGATDITARLVHSGTGEVKVNRA